MELQILIWIAVIVILLTTWILARRSGTEDFNINPDQNGDNSINAQPGIKFDIKTEVKFKKEKKQKHKNLYSILSAEECYAFGKRYINMGSYQKAIEPLKRAVSLKSGYADAYFMLGTAFNKMGAYEEAVEPLRNTIRLSPENINAYCILGIAYNELERYGDAANAFNQALALKPDDPEAHFGLGITCHRDGKLDLAKNEHGILININRYLADELLKLIKKTDSDDQYQSSRKIRDAMISLDNAVNRGGDVISFKDFFTKDDERLILEAIKQAELRTSGEIRVRVEKNAGQDIMQTARSAFEELGMRKTHLRNGVMFLLAVIDRKFVVLGDDGINNKVPANFWDKTRDIVQENFRKNLFAQGLAEGVKLAGEQLTAFFPYKKEDVNELPDAISYADKAGE